MLAPDTIPTLPGLVLAALAWATLAVMTRRARR